MWGWRGFLRQAAIRDHARDLSEAYDIRGPGINAPARLLSGGNIQKLILARVFECAPRLILANQPTRGLDLGAAGEVARRLLEARKRGAGVLLISEDLDEVLALSDRIVDNGTLPRLLPRMRIHSGLIVALIAAAIAHIMLSKSVWGFKLRAVGENAAAALHAGIGVKRTVMTAAAVSGALAGLAGVSEVAGQLVSPLCGPTFSYGRHPFAGHAAHERVGHTVRGYRALGRAETRAIGR